jgi:hypothetical protein
MTSLPSSSATAAAALTDTFTITAPVFGSAASQGYVKHVLTELTPLLPTGSELLRWAVVAQQPSQWIVEATYLTHADVALACPAS